MLFIFWCTLLLTAVTANENFTINDYKDLLRPGSGVYGSVSKKGMVPLEVWIKGEFEENRKGLFDEWYKDPSKKYTVPPLSSFCRIFVNHQYKLIFVRNRKAASTTFVDGFNNMCGQNRSRDSELFWSGFNSKKHLGGKKPESFWGSYKVFTVSRNPWARAFSAWKHVLLRDNPSSESLRDLVSQNGWEAFSRDPYIIARMCDEKEVCEDKKWSDYYRRHVEPFARCIQNKNGGLAIDYIIRYENVEEDWAAFQELLNKRSGLPKINKPLEHCREPILRLSAEQFYHKCGMKCVKSLSAYYKEDLDAFGFSVPKKMASAIQAGVEEDWPGDIFV